MDLPTEKVPVVKDGKRYLCTVELLAVSGGKQVIYVDGDGTVIKTEPLYRYNERIKRRKASGGVVRKQE